MIFWKGRTLAIWENTVLAFQTLADRKFRSFLTVMGVSIGVIIIIGVASVLNGFRQRIIDNTEQWGTSNVYLTRWPMVQMGRPDFRMRRRKRFVLEDAWAIRNECPTVVAVNPEMRNSVTSIKAGTKELSSGNLRGVFPEARDVLTLPITSGRFFTSEENRRSINVCVVGWNITNTLFDAKDPVGKMITVQGERLAHHWHARQVQGRLRQQQRRRFRHLHPLFRLQTDVPLGLVRDEHRHPLETGPVAPRDR